MKIQSWKIWQIAVTLCFFTFHLGCQSSRELVIVVENPSDFTRIEEVISISWAEIQRPFSESIHAVIVMNSQGEKIVSQIVYEDPDERPDELLFQADFDPNEKMLFIITPALEKHQESESKVHAAYMPDGMEDFNWENDRIGYRFYGTARKVEGISSGIDVWCKRVPYRMIEKWYDPNINYHDDRGEGADYYAVKATRGCGGTAIWVNGEMLLSEPFTDWEIIAEGPIRTIFELRFPAMEINGKRMSEIKRVSLDAGTHLCRFDLTFQSDGMERIPLVIGISDHKNSIHRYQEQQGWLSTWEPLGKERGELGCAIILDHASNISDFKNYEGHYLLFTEAIPEQALTYYTGSCWSEYGNIRSAQEWETYLEVWIEKKHNPLVITVGNIR